MVGRSEIFVNFGIKGGVGKLPKSFLSVKVGPPNNYRAAFVGRFDNNIFAFAKTFECCPFFCRKVRDFNVALKFKFLNIATAFFKEANWPSGEVHLDSRTLRVSKTSFSEVLELSSLSWKKAFIEHGKGIFQRLV